MMPEFNIKVCMPLHVQKPVRVKLRLLHLFFALPCLIVIISCNNSSSANNNEPDSLAVLKLPEPSPVSPEEAARIKAACELWYDSALKQKGFNGGILVAKTGISFLNNIMARAISPVQIPFQQIHHYILLLFPKPLRPWLF